MIEIRHLRKEFPNITPLQDVNATVNAGDVITLIGSSGTGKSTLLRCLNRLETATSGEVWLDGENILSPSVDVTQVRRRMGMVFQSFNLWSHLLIAENIMSGPVKLLGLSKQEAYEQALSLLDMVGLRDKALSYPSELSGGQQQRVAIVRALAMKPRVMLFDEPTSALDPTMVGEVESVIRRLRGEGLTMMIVSHEMQFARSVSNRVFFMEKGIIAEDGSPEQIFDHPQTESCRIFVRRLKMLYATLDWQHRDIFRLNSQVETFGRQMLMEQRLILDVQSVLEELCWQNVLPQLPEQSSLELSIGYQESSGLCEVSLNWRGPAYDPLTEGDSLSVKIALRHAQSSLYQRTEDENRVLVTL